MSDLKSSSGTPLCAQEGKADGKTPETVAAGMSSLTLESSSSTPENRIHQSAGHRRRRRGKPRPLLLRRLSAELRNRIWELSVVMDHSVKPYHYDRDGPIRRVMIPPLAQVNRQIRLEVLPMYLHMNTFELVNNTQEMSCSAVCWLRSLGPHAKHMKRLHLVLCSNHTGHKIELELNDGAKPSLIYDEGTYYEDIGCYVFDAHEHKIVEEIVRQRHQEIWAEDSNVAEKNRLRHFIKLTRGYQLKICQPR